MLAGIKNKTKGWVAYFIIGIIAIPFTLFGIHDYINNTNNVTIASVNGEEITQAEYYERLDALVRSAQVQFGENYTPEIENALRRQAFESSINYKILEFIAESLEFTTTNDEIKNDILTNEIFFNDDGTFDLETYNSILALNGTTPKRYEETLLKDKTITQLQTNLEDSAFFSNKQLEILAQLIHEQRDVSFSKINIDDFNTDDQITDITDSTIAQYYEENKEEIIHLETITIDYITLDNLAILETIEVSEDEILDQYEIEKERYQTEEERDVSHILVEDDTLADEIKQKLDNGEDFAQLAQEFSIDIASASNGGSLGLLVRGITEPEFEEEAFTLNIGDVSVPISTNDGYHILKVNSIKEAQTKSFEELEEELTDTVKETKARLKMLELSEQLLNTVYEQGLEIAAEDLELTLTTSEPIGRESDKFPLVVVNTAFSDEVRTTDEAVVVEVDENTSIALRKNTFTPSSVKSLEEAREEIVSILRQERALELANTYAQELINKDEELDTSIGWTYRDNTSTDEPRAVDLAFATPRGEKYRTLSDDSSILVVKVNDIRNKERNVNYNILHEYYSQELFDDVIDYVKNISNIKRYEVN